jgi:hypothetical protein
MAIDRPVVFQICAHPDDWILFGNGSELRDLGSLNSVIILTTAGDAQCRDAWWQVREHAAVAAMQVGLDNAPITANAEVVTGSNPHSTCVYRCMKEDQRCALYSLRLFNRSHTARDPGLWELYHGTSLAGTVDNSTVYTSWEDFCLTLKAIVLRESGDATPHIHTHLYRSDESINPGDHCEHTLTGLAVKSFARPYLRSWWWGYETMRHHNEEGWQIKDSSALVGKWRLWSAYKQVVLDDIAEGAQLSSDSLRWANAGVMDSEWNSWGEVAHADLCSPDQDDPYPV